MKPSNLNQGKILSFNLSYICWKENVDYVVTFDYVGFINCRTQLSGGRTRVIIYCVQT